jgi:RHS repeat-associated protein
MGPNLREIRRLKDHASRVLERDCSSFRYTARELDSKTGLYYYRARDYDPSTGRFLSR